MRRNPVQGVFLCLLAVFALAFGSLQVVSGAPLVYEGFSGSADGAGDDYEFDATIRSTSDARTGFTGAWDDPVVATGLDFESRNDNSDYTGLTTGTAGALEIYESRAGQSATGRAITRELSYTTPTDDLYIAFSWSTADGAALSVMLDDTSGGAIDADCTVSVSTNGTVSTAFAGSSKVNYSSSAGAAHQDGTWNLFVMKWAWTGGNYDDIEVWLNPTISGGSLGTPDKDDCSGIVRRLDLANPTSYGRAGFNATVGTGDEVRFDEFYITTDLSSIIAGPPAGTVLVIR